MCMRRVLITVLILTVSVLVAGCSQFGISGGFKPSENSAYIEKDGGVRWASVETCEDESFTEAELKSFALERISAYNKSLGKGDGAENKDGSETLPAALVSAKIEDGKAYLVTEYDKADRLVDFAREIGDYNVTFTTLETGRTAYFATDFPEVSFLDEKGNAVDAKTVSADSSKVAVKAEGQGIVKTESKVLYISDNCVLKDGNTVQTSSEGTSYIILK